MRSSLVVTLVPLLVACSPCTPAFRECPPIPQERLAALPSRLSETGLFSDTETEELADGVMPFTPRFELWSDGAWKRRWIRLPPDTQIDSSDPNAWNFPTGTRMWKEFTRGGVRVETRLLVKHGPEPRAWTPLAYVWTDDGEAWATPDGSIDAAGTPHDVPSSSQCMGCHGGTQSGVLGFSAVQLPEHGEDGNVGIADLSDAGLFTTPVSPSEIPGDATTSAALGYLHANCSHCHNQRRPAGSGPRCFDPEREFDFSLWIGELDTPVSTATYRTAIGEVIDPGNPSASDVVIRARSRDTWWGMPALGTEVVDADGVLLLDQWIRSL